MYIIMVYDVNEKRTSKILKISRKYLHWVQNSVLEGEITDAAFYKLKQEISKKIDMEEDSVIFYILRTTKYSNREMLGKAFDPNKLVL